MSRQNRANRKAKQQARRHGKSRRPRPPGFAEDPTATDPRMAVREALAQAVPKVVAGIPAAHCASQLYDRFPGAENAVQRAVDEAAGEVVAALVSHGWSPVDLFELARRNVDARGVDYALDCVARVTDGYPSARVHPRWRAQLEQVGAQVWWRHDETHVAQWTRRHGRTQVDALATVLSFLAATRYLPYIAPVMPAPGTVQPVNEAGGSGGVDARMLAKVRALLAKAESTEFSEEAEALSAKAQSLMSRYALHRAVREQQAGAEQHASVRRIWLDNPYVGAKAHLVSAVARANRCRTVLSEDLGFISVIGDELDLELVELLSTSLLIQATRAMLGAGSQTTRSGVSRTRSFRRTFLIGYASRIGERLRDSDDAEVAASDRRELLPVLAARSQVVDDTLAALFPRLVTKSVSVSNAAGWGAGRAAADLARLDVRESLGSAESRAS